MDKRSEKAQETRQRNKAWREAREAEKQEDGALVLEALRHVLKDPEATTAQRLHAVAVLDNMQSYHFAPCGAKYPGKDKDAAIEAFAKELEAFQKKENK